MQLALEKVPGGPEARCHTWVGACWGPIILDFVVDLSFLQAGGSLHYCTEEKLQCQACQAEPLHQLKMHPLSWAFPPSKHCAAALKLHNPACARTFLSEMMLDPSSRLYQEPVGSVDEGRAPRVFYLPLIKALGAISTPHCQAEDLGAGEAGWEVCCWASACQGGEMLSLMV